MNTPQANANYHTDGFGPGRFLRLFFAPLNTEHWILNTLFLLLLAALAPRAEAADRTWDNGESGDWNDTAHWGGNPYPVAGDNALWISVNNATYTDNINVNGQYSISDLKMDWAGNTLKTTHNVNLVGTVAGASLAMNNLYMAYGRGSTDGDYGSSLLDYLFFSNMSLTVGSPSSRGMIQMGQKTGTYNNGSYGFLTAGSNSAFAAYLTSMKLGFGGHTSGQGFGYVYLNSATSVVLDVSGNVEVASSSTGENYYRSAELHIGNGRAVAGNLYLGYTTFSDGQTGAQPNKNGALALYNNAIFAVVSGGKAYFGGRGNNAVNPWDHNNAVANIGSGGGLDIQNSASDGLTLKYPSLLNNDGANHYIYNQINVTLPGIDGATNGWYWGLRWAGNHATNNTQTYTGGGATGLRALLDSSDIYARLRVVTNGLTSQQLTSHLTRLQSLDPATYGSKTIGNLTPADFIINDSGYTYVGVFLGLSPSSAPTIQNQPVTNVTTSSATFNGTLTSTGSSACAVCVLWGEQNGGATWNWANTNWFNGGAVNVAWTNNTLFSTNIVGGIDPNKTYYCTFAATNETTNTVASSPVSFITGEVTVQATSNTAVLFPSTNGQFTIYRPVTCTNEPLTVYYTLTGTATNGTHYTGTNDLALPLSATFGAGATTTVVTLKAQAGAGGTAILTLSSGYNYPVGAVNTGTVTVLPFAGIAWTGASSTDWGIAGNWAGGVPGPSDDVVINVVYGGATTNHPTINLSSAVTIKSLTIGSTTASTLTFNNSLATDVNKRLRVTGDVTIGPNGTLTHVAESASGTGGSAQAEKSQLFLDVGGDLTIAANGTINVSSRGYFFYTGGNPYNGYGPGGAADYSGGAGHGGEGGKSGTVGGTTYDSVTNPTNSGSGAAPNRGGGAVKLTVGGGLTVNGSISADGGGGAGVFVDGASGGSVNITAGTMAGTGTISANGGGGTTDADRGAGGGGRVAIVLTGVAQSTFDAWFSPTRIKAYGGSHTTAAKAGAAGTVYLKGNSGNGRLIADNDNASSTTLSTTLVKGQTLLFDRIEAKNRGFVKLGSGCTLDLSQGCVLTSDGTSRFIIDSAANPTIQWPASYTLGGVGTNCTLSWSGSSQYTINCANLTVATNGVLTHEPVTIQDTTSLEDNKLIATIQGNLTVDAGALIYVSLKGYGGTSGNGAGYGPGRGTGDGQSAAHGGEGGNGTAPTYGSVTDPVRCGSGAGYSVRGGGVVKLTISGALTLNGSILADGGANYMSGSGGSVNILAGMLAGNGIVSAVGVNGGNSGSGGGRVAIVLTNASDTAIYALSAIRANGGAGSTTANAGGAGTVYLKGTNNVYGNLIVDNANVANSSTTPKRTLINSTVGDLTLGDVILQNQGRLSYDSTSRKVTAYGSWSNLVSGAADSALATVTLAGGSPATVWGANNWYSLIITNDRKVVSFQAGANQAVNGAGTATFDNFVTLKSTTDGSWWYLTKGTLGGGTQNVGKVYAKDSNASNGWTFAASGGSDLSGNCRNWRFPPKGMVIMLR